MADSLNGHPISAKEIRSNAVRMQKLLALPQHIGRVIVRPEFMISASSVRIGGHSKRAQWIARIVGDIVKEFGCPYEIVRRCATIFIVDFNPAQLSRCHHLLRTTTIGTQLVLLAVNRRQGRVSRLLQNLPNDQHWCQHRLTLFVRLVGQQHCALLFHASF